MSVIVSNGILKPSTDLSFLKEKGNTIKMHQNANGTGFFPYLKGTSNFHESYGAHFVIRFQDFPPTQ